MMDPNASAALALLRLQIEWGADEALDEQAHDRMAAAAPSRLLEPASRAIPPPAAMLAAPRGRQQEARQQEAREQACSADSLAALRAATEAFTGCALRDTASHTLFAEGDPAAGLLLIGEVPDADEDRAGQVFAGASGALLDRMLASIGLSRGGMLIAPLIPWRPPGDRKPSPAEIAACLPFLHRLVTLVRPRHLILMGARPARTLLGSETPLARLRGRWAAASIPELPEPVPALPMRHPATLLATASMRREAWHDLLLLRSTLDGLASQSGDVGRNERP